MTLTIAAFSGGIGSGKTTLSQAVASELGWMWGSFGEFVRVKAEESSLDSTDRRILQDLGETLALGSPGVFVREFLGWLSWMHDSNLVIDGLRHVAVLSALKTITLPSNVVAIYLDANFYLRQSRIQREGELRSLEELEDHPVEEETLLILRSIADLVVDSSGDKIRTSRLISAWIRQRAL